MKLKDIVKIKYIGSCGMEYHFRKHSIDLEVIGLVSRIRSLKIQPYIKHDDTVLEYGVGTGLNMLQLQCAHRFGYDLSDAGKEICERNGINFTTDIRSLINYQFSVIICHHVLEHVPDVVDVLEQIKGLLKPGGKLLLFVPFETHNKYRRYQPNDPDMHLFSWNVQTLGNLISSCNYEVEIIKINPFGYEQYFSFLGRINFTLYKAGLSIIRKLRPANEIFLLAKKNE